MGSKNSKRDGRDDINNIETKHNIATQPTNSNTTSTTTTTSNTNNNTTQQQWEEILKFPLPSLGDMKKIVEEKLLTNDIYSGKLKHNRPLLEKFRDALCVKDELIKTYLTTDWAETKKLTMEMMSQCERSTSALQSTVSQSTAVADVGVVTNNEVDDEDELGVVEQEENPDIINMGQAKIKIKFIVSEVSHTASKRAIRRLISPVVSAFDDTFPE